MAAKEQVKKYLKDTRDPWIATLLLFPVYLVYQLGLAITPGVRNGADVVTDLLLALGRWQPYALWGLGAALVVGYGVLVFMMRKKRRFHPSLFGFVALEGAVLGVIMLLLVNKVMSMILLGPNDGGYPFHVDVILSLGAGFHEELIFRMLLFGGAVFVVSKIMKKPAPIWVVLVAAVVSSAIFSAIHYIGPLGDPFRLGSFVFRFLSGCYFVAVYRLRGFAVAVYTHAIYDIGVFAMGA